MRFIRSGSGQAGPGLLEPGAQAAFYAGLPPHTSGAVPFTFRAIGADGSPTVDGGEAMHEMCGGWRAAPEIAPTLS